jgi:hypothetical protein
MRAIEGKVPKSMNVLPFRPEPRLLAMFKAFLLPPGIRVSSQRYSE